MGAYDLYAASEVGYLYYTLILYVGPLVNHHYHEIVSIALIPLTHSLSLTTHLYNNSSW